MRRDVQRSCPERGASARRRAPCAFGSRTVSVTLMRLPLPVSRDADGAVIAALPVAADLPRRLGVGVERAAELARGRLERPGRRRCARAERAAPAASTTWTTVAREAMAPAAYRRARAARASCRRRSVRADVAAEARCTGVRDAATRWPATRRCPTLRRRCGAPRDASERQRATCRASRSTWSTSGRASIRRSGRRAARLAPAARRRRPTDRAPARSSPRHGRGGRARATARRRGAGCRFAWCSSVSMIARSAWASARGGGVGRLGQRAAEGGDHERVGFLVERRRRWPRRRRRPRRPRRRRSRRGARARRRTRSRRGVGAKPAASRSLRRNASALARPARAGRGRAARVRWRAGGRRRRAGRRRRRCGRPPRRRGRRRRARRRARAGAGGRRRSRPRSPSAGRCGPRRARDRGGRTARAARRSASAPCARPSQSRSARPRVGVYKWRMRSASPYRSERRTIPSVFTDPDIALYFLKS